MHLAVSILITFSLVGCAPFDRLARTKTEACEWKLGDFRVRFLADPQGQEERSESCYRIRYQAAGEQERELVMASAHTLEGFNCVTHSDPKNWIRMIGDPNGKALLIEEEIPNDCGPCSNYLWVHLDAGGCLKGTYLLLPSQVTGEPGAGIDYEYPRVHFLNGDVLQYRYSVGAPVNQRIDRIEKSNRPTPPG